MTRTGRTLHEYLSGGAAGMVALSHFVAHIPSDAALWRAMSGHEDYAGWEDRLTTNRVLTDIWNALAALNANLVRANSKKKGSTRDPEPYPTPWARKRKKKFGRDPVKVSEFGSWWSRKSKKSKSREG